MNEHYRKTLPNFRFNGAKIEYFDSQQAVEELSKGSFKTLPYTCRVLAEQLVRRSPAGKLEEYLSQIVFKKKDVDFPWYPARVVCHDILGQTALVDLAGLRDAIAEKGGDPSLVNPVVPTQLIVDHSLAVEHDGKDSQAFSKNRAIEERRNKDRFDFIEWCKTSFSNVDVIPAGNGIMHQINLEKMASVVALKDGVAFPDTCVGTDSHTPHVDALGVLGIGVGGLEAETVMLGQPSMMRLPEIVGVRLVGNRQVGITATDIVLGITEFLRQQNVISAFLEFFGEGVKQLTIGDRATIANMTPEYGASAGLFYIDQQTIDYLVMTGRAPEQITLVKQYAKHTGLWASTLNEVKYDRVLEFDISQVSRNIAGPSNPHKRVATSQLTQQGIAKPFAQKSESLVDGAIIIAAITSCTNTSNPRNVIAAGLIARNANRLGITAKPWVKTSFAPGSKVAKLYLQEAGLLRELEQQGFGIVGYACTTCNGMSGALEPSIERQIQQQSIHTVAVLSGNRNFDGRIHPSAKEAFLASPPLVVAYAIAGNIQFDIEQDVLGVDQNGQPIRLKDIWPTDTEIDEMVAKCVKPLQFKQVYTPMFDLTLKDHSTKALYDWDTKSTYIRQPPYWQGALAKPRTLTDMRPLAILGDNITTDHLSPSNAILRNSAAGEYLSKMGLDEQDFNSYATHRGDHHTAQRATFANPKLINEMVTDEAGSVIQGSLARLEPEGQVMRMWETIETYMNRQQPLIVIAGEAYGQGSSRDWAAKGVRLAGVEVIVAKGFERIHRTNLVGMGVLPLEFNDQDDRKNLNLDGTETYSVSGDIQPNANMCLTISPVNQPSFNVIVTCRLDTEEEVHVYHNGGVLQSFAKHFLSHT